ncbi:Lrp/AsnC family transcriptional regulator [Pseudomonas sp. zfem005]|uniref:Lrp/AsnC family transcriptional regulator n=1 Tax=Pseudomonas sp. zfem005 TaxID=3078200 RepID=UPI0029278760|nr:Lrp/AsnC family transcriptional regulator [Pseudomonas sp. zfem005]MDU9413483.1 Lrp/AsnC family transcriptional regulator [Pseudomonas sp. zfem005]
MEKLDRYDLKILAELQRDARTSNQELAERIGLSPSPCSRRVKQLEDDGYIVRQVALLDRKKLGLSLTAYVLIGMDRHTPERFEHFQSVIGQCPEVLECCLVTGMEADYQLKVVVPDMDHYQQFLLGQLTRIEGVTSVRSSFVLNQVLSTTELPLTHLRG